LGTVLAAMLLYSEVGSKASLKKMMVLAFSIGIFSLITSIILFSALVLTAPPKYYPD